MTRQFPPSTASQLEATMGVAKALLDLYEPDAAETNLIARAVLAIELTAVLARDARAFALLDQALPGARLAERVLELPQQLAEASQIDSALELVRALAFISPDLLHGDEALILANAGRRDEALALVSTNLSRAKDIPTAEAKAGDVYRALGEADAAEAYYRRALAESRSPMERSEAVLRIVSLLSDNGREQDAAALLKQERERQAERPAPGTASLPKVGRNEPCPCGSGKKYKKCHGSGG